MNEDLINAAHTGDSFEVLEEFSKNSVHAIVTDPPYGLAFMGRSWDDFEPKEYQEFCENWATKAKRVLKPGGHIVAFSGNRTHHRLFSGVEDAGFEIRDTLTWHYGSGFPKALGVGKAIDKQEGAEREVLEQVEKKNPATGADYGDYGNDNTLEITEPATEPAKKWDGFKTALKPATEFIVLGRKELSESTVAENIQAHGTGALNIDATRIETNESWEGEGEHDTLEDAPKGVALETSVDGTLSKTKRSGSHDKGRYPANVIFDEIEATVLDEKVGELGGGPRRTNADVDGSEWDNDVNPGFTEGRDRSMFVNEGPDDGVRQFGDSGGPSRYFYTSKASKAERTENGSIENKHPTVKPVDLMEWLVKLVTAENQTILDPFAGSGTTLKAAKNLNRDFIGIEKQEQWADVARARVGLTPNDPSNVRADDAQQGLGEFTDGS